MSAQIGRPKVKNPKNIDVKVRFDENSYNELIEYCNKNNLTKTEAIRQGIKLLLVKKNSGT